MKKHYLLYAIVPVMIFSAVGLAASAASLTEKTSPMSGLVAAIAQKFNLNATDVQKVFDEQKVQMHAEMRSQMKEKLSERLAKAVVDGKLTQDQANKITAKVAELQTNKPNLEGKTKEEIKALMKSGMDSLKKWASDNNIPLEYVRPIKPMGGPGHMMPRFEE